MSAAPVTFQETGQRRRIVKVLLPSVGVLFALGSTLLATEDSVLGGAVIAVAVVDLGLAAWWLGSPSRRRAVAIGPDGIQVTLGRGSIVLLPWRDVGSWAIGQTFVGTAIYGSSNRGLLVWPADHVTEPDPETRRLWQAGSRCWRVCRIPEISATEEELRAAVRTYVPQLERELDNPQPD